MTPVLRWLARHVGASISRRSGYGVAIALAVASLLFRQSLGVPFTDRPLLLMFVLPIIVSAFIGGFGPGLLTTALVALGSRILFIPPVFSLAIASVHDLYNWIFLIVDGVLVSVLCDAVRRGRHQLEQMVRARTLELAEARDRADAANAAKSAFLANMSHEIRTPLNAILGLARLMHRDSSADLRSTRVAKIQDSARHLLSLINDILDLSKIESGRLELEQANFALTTVFDQVRSMISEPAAAKGIRVEVDTDSVPLWLLGDPTRLRQALLNYASNAVKFTERGSIAIRALLLADQGERVQLRFEVQDTGIGIDAEHLPRLFGAFEQIDSSATRRFGGTGLGLAITLRLARLMGGDAGVASEPGRGSTFWFTVWMARGRNGEALVQAGPAALEAEQRLVREFSGARVLLVEDHPINREVAVEQLETVGLLVDPVANGRQAVDKLASAGYDLVLMDVQMPVMDGLAATRAIRGMPEHGRLPILAMTANAFTEDREACLAAGMNDFVAKPIDADVLYPCLLRWLTATRSEEAKSAPPAPGRFAALPGVDFDRGLQIANGRVDLYERLLELFAQTHGSDAAEFRRAGASGDRSELNDRAHRLKSSAGSVGALRVRDAAIALEQALRANAPRDQLEPRVAALCADLDLLVDAIHKAS